MPVILNRLNAKQVEHRIAPGVYADGGGLWLNVTDKGAKSWRFIYRWEGKRPELGLGSYPAVGLADARRRAEDARGWLAAKPKRDPKDLFKAPPPPPESKAFGEFTEAFLDQILPDFRNAKHRQQWRNTLKTYAADLWKTDIAAIETQQVLEALQPIWGKKRETARRVRGRIERILDAAKAQGLRSGENPARWRGHLSAILPDNRKDKHHHAAMPFDDVPGLMRALAGREDLTAKALRFVVLTGARSGEARGARWEEIDLVSRVWTVPGERMKAGRPHRVPLSEEASAIVQELSTHRLSEFVFPGQGKADFISETSIRKLLRRLKAEGVTIHGFRSSFRDWAGERTQFPREVAEQALAHRVGDETERAYRRGDALDKRRLLMQAWADFCTGKEGARIVPMRA
jgi:integrase